MNQTNIRTSVWSVLWRIAIFMAYYFLLIGIGLLIIAAVIVFVTNYAIPIISALNGTLFLLAIIAFVGICCLAVMFAAFLIKPLFSFTESTESDNTVEVEREDCPELYEVISDIVKQTGTKMPKHVYLSADVNACVFFDSSIWSIFLPIRKNLKIGLGLLNGLSVDEFKSILAHEFGHFSQKSMKIGSSVYVVNQILYNMTTEKDNWDDLLESWCTPDSDNMFSNTFAFFGILTRGLTSWVKKANIMMYGFVQKSYMKLSRQMEYDADNIACSCVGKDAFISAMYKTEVNASNNSDFIDILKALFEEKKTVDNVFDAIEATNKALHHGDPSYITYDVPLYQPLTVESRIRVNDSRSSHPLLADRIENAQKNETKETGAPIVAWSLVSKDIAAQVSVPFFWNFKEYEKRTVINNEEYTIWVNEYVKTHYIPSRFRAFFGRNILPFDLSFSSDNELENPFTNRNRQIIDDYFVTLNDRNLLKRIANREIETKSLYVDGQTISDKSLPLKEYDDYLSILYPKICEMDQNVYHYLQKNCKDSDRTKLENAYSILFYAETALNTSLTNLINGGAQARANLNAMMESYQGFNVNAAIQIVQQYVAYFHQCLKEMNLEAMELVVGKKYISKVEEFLAMSEDEKNVSDLNYLNKITGDLPDDLYGIHQSLIGMARKTLCEISNPFYLKDEEKDTISEEQNENKRINPITIDYTAGGASVLHIMGVFAVLFFVIALLCYLLYPKQDDSGTMAEKENTEILRTPFEGENSIPSNNEQDIMSILMQEKNSQIKAKDNEISDGRIAIRKMTGVKYEKYYPDSTKSDYYAITLYDDKEAPTYGIRIISDHITGGFGYNEFKDFVKSYEEGRELNTTQRTVSEDDGYLDHDTYCYEVHKTYRTYGTTDYNFHVDIAAIRSYKAHKICYVICESMKGTKTPFNEVVNNIRFE